MARGTVMGRVVTAGGRAPGANNLMVDGIGDGPGVCGGGDIGYGVGEDGRFQIPCARGGWTIIVQARGEGGGEWITIGQVHVTVPADGTVRARIMLDAGAVAGG
jgi:hypothetical protein